jgi:ketosteroid isomerase-like protein
MSGDDVCKASHKFYSALNKMANGDSESMADAWWHGATVSVMHPIGGRTVGWDAVAASFAKVASVASNGRVELRDQVIEVCGDMAYEMGLEVGALQLGGNAAAIDHRVTNVYRREDGEWRMVHHHTDTSPAMIEVLGKLQAATG